MKLVQVGILIALVAVGALLFLIWWDQLSHPAAVSMGGEAEEPVVEVASDGPVPAVEPEPVVAQTRKPSPAPRTQTPSRSQAASAPVRQETATTAPPEAASATSIPAPPEVASSVRAPDTASAIAPPPKRLPAQPRTVTLAAGTLISARLAETLASDKMKVGETFLANLDSPLVVDGLVIAERGGRVQGRVVELEEAGRVKGLAELGIQLVGLTTRDGQNVEIQTDTFRVEGPTSKTEDAAKIGAGAGLGAAIGAIAGGGRGAAIGAAAGGAAGTGTVMATRGKPAVIPVETRIDFRVNAPVTLTEAVR